MKREKVENTRRRDDNQKGKVGGREGDVEEGSLECGNEV